MKTYRPSRFLIIIFSVLLLSLFTLFYRGDTASTKINNSMVVPNLSATKTAAILTDVNSNGVVNPGDSIRYTVQINNTGVYTKNSLSNQTITLQAKNRGNPWINFQDGIDQIFTYSSNLDAKHIVENSEATPKAMASSDFDEDGVPDLVAGYASLNGGILTIHRGNIDSIHPNAPEATQRKVEGQFVDAPFLPEANAMSLPESADYLGAGDFDADGHWDVVTVRQGSSLLYLMRGDGRGGFDEPKQIMLDGIVTSLATGEINRADGLTDVAIGIVAAEGAKLLVFEGPEGAMNSEPERFSLPAEAKTLSIGQLDDEYTMDLAVGAGSELLIIHGRDRKLSLDESERNKVPPAVVSQQSYESIITSTALGDFTGKRRKEIAVLLSNGEIKIVSLGKGETKQLKKSNLLLPDNWKESSLLIRAKVSSLPQDDLVLIDKANHKLHILGGEKEKESADRVAISLDIDTESMAVLPMRLNVDALQDLVILKKGQNNLTVAMTAPMSTFVVNSTGDGDDCSGTDGVCSLGTVVKGQCQLTNVCTLRAAIQQANANPGLDAISFSIGSGTQTITPLSQLTFITSPITIDGTTQPGFSGSPIIELNGITGGAYGIRVESGNSTVSGLVVNRFSTYGITLFTNGGSVIQGNYIGTDVTATTALLRQTGIAVSSSSNNMIGGMVSQARNLISGNGSYGVVIFPSDGNVLQGNFIGSNASGTAALGNTAGGVQTQGGTNTIIGGTVTGARNIISGSIASGLSGHGIFIYGIGPTGILIQGNYIGTNVTGTATISNGRSGILVQASNITVGGTTVGARNIISGNSNEGVKIDNLNNSNPMDNLIQGNYIGTDVTGTIDLGNVFDGISLTPSPNNTIGGIPAGTRNIISGNNSNGIRINGSTSIGNQVLGNYIGTDVNGTADLGNSIDGIRITGGANNNSIGGTTSGTRNVISGNNFNGVTIQDFSTENFVQGNYIGTDITGTVDLGNSIYGVSIFSVSNNIIGGTSAAARNIISGNDNHGVIIFTTTGPTATGNLIQGNYIGTDVTGTADLGNSSIGVNILSATNNTIGGTSAGARNIISGNNTYGVTISNNSGPNATGNLIQGNYIGTDVNGTSNLGNSLSGVLIAPTSSNNTIGGTSAGARNIISGNNNNGVLLTGSNTTNNFVWGNYIGTDVNGTASLGNSLDGVNINGGASNNSIGGTTAGTRNIISGNNGNGIQINGSTSTSNQILGNFIGTKANGILALGNNGHGVFITNSANNNTIGGVTSNVGNIIQNNSGDGVYVDSGTGNGIVGNSIFGNSGLGIDLGPNGITPNDTGDGDTGANNLQNFPVLTEVNNSGSSTTMRGTLKSIPNTAFTLHFYSNSQCDSSGSGEGQSFLGISTVKTVMTDGNGNANLDNISLPVGIAVGQFVTATATDPNNNTSEFSQCRVVRYKLTIHFAGPGSGQVTSPSGINCNSNMPSCDIFFDTVSPVQLNAMPTDDGSLFSHWQQDCKGSNPRCELTMNQSKEVTAIFLKNGFEEQSRLSLASVNAKMVIIWSQIQTHQTGFNQKELNKNDRINVRATSLIPTIENVKIELSRNGGATFETIFASTTNDGSECWQVTAPTTTQALIRISSTDNPSINGISAHPFEIINSPGSGAITPGPANCGDLTTGDGRSPIRGSSFYADRYTFSGTAGQQIAISLESAEFDTYLYLINPVNSVIAEDDNGGGGTNSRIPSGSDFLTLPSSGIYTIEATSALPNATGSYTLTLGEPCHYLLSSTSQTFPFAGGDSSINVTAATICDWTTVSNASWITITSGNNGNGNGSVAYSVAANPDAARTGTITTAGQIFTVNQNAVAPSYEADVSARPNGDGSILSDDVVQIRRFLNGTNAADQTTDEFQRADSSPFVDRGDGRIFSDDVVQARRYQNGTNTKQLASGPMTQAPPRPAEMVDQLFGGLSKTVIDSALLGNPREVRVENAMGSAGQNVTVNIRVNAVGNESEYGFIVNYDSTILSNPVVGAGTAGASVRSCNIATVGQVNCSVGGFPTNNPMSSEPGIGEIAAGTNQLLITVQFTIAANAQPGTTPLTLSNVNASSDAPQLLFPAATNGTVTILAPTAASSQISGRVVTTDGRAVFSSAAFPLRLNSKPLIALCVNLLR